MIHKMTPISNPRLFIFYSIMLGMPLLGALSFKVYPPIVAALLTGAGCFLSYRFFKFAQPFLSTRITTTEEGITFTLPKEGDVVFTWKEITLAGKCLLPNGKPFIFAYHLGRDKLITIPFEYQDMKGLQAELEKKTSFETFKFEAGRSIHDVLTERYPEILERKKNKN